MSDDTPLSPSESNGIISSTGSEQPESFQQVYTTFETITFVTNPLSHLEISKQAKVIRKLPCITYCRTFLPFENYYNTIVDSTNGWQYLLNNCFKFGCNLFPCDLFNRPLECNNSIIASYNDLISNKGIEYAKMEKEENCQCAGLCTKYFDVNITTDNEKKMAGIVKIRGPNEWLCQLCTCKCECRCECKCDCLLDCLKCKLCVKCFTCDCNDYFYTCEILTPTKDLKYTIYLTKCCFDYCMAGRYCNVKFTIKDLSNSPVGYIHGFPSFCDCSFVYKIDFPADATPELKLTILNAIYVIDSFGLF